ncbi:uncharacterized protein LOC125760024 isoform X1 [Rhipicephalus sanguineus]|uniref:uncharacterized protein LOC119388925 isoform X3 n=1 Tax=Rhipicephalus sanguineus TaxID=34632 RepID=UPI0020C57BB9|nr:uncharacterized protein LOC119388925 isoform X3 [Rhipicephalus sanguineus]XP_049275570.1 uncharacterized protein LOC125760024 isoform X1 [Rhipicephalus sanguineus]
MLTDGSPRSEPASMCTIWGLPSPAPPRFLVGNNFRGLQLMPQLRDGGNRQAEALELLAANTRRQGQASLESCARFNFSVTRSTNCKALVPSPGPSLQRKPPAQ